MHTGCQQLPVGHMLAKQWLAWQDVRAEHVLALAAGLMTSAAFCAASDMVAARFF